MIKLLRSSRITNYENLTESSLSSALQQNASEKLEETWFYNYSQSVGVTSRLSFDNEEVELQTTVTREAKVFMFLFTVVTLGICFPIIRLDSNFSGVLVAFALGVFGFIFWISFLINLQHRFLFSSYSK